MENNDRLWGGDNLFWGLGQFGVAPNGLGYTYPGMMPFWGIGLEPNLWADAGNQTEMDNQVMRNNNNYMKNQVMPIEMLYPKCSKMIYDCIFKECAMFVNNNGGIMPNKICKEEFCKMIKNCSNHIMENENMFNDMKNSEWVCKRNSDVEDNEQIDSVDTRFNPNISNNLFVESVMAMLLLQELRRRGCIYCY